MVNPNALIGMTKRAWSMFNAPEEALVGRTILTFLVIAESLICVFWIFSLSSLGEAYTYIAAVPYFYITLSFITLFVFYRLQRFDYFIFTQLIMLLSMPFFMQWIIGGFAASSGVAIWAILSPVGALMIRGRKQSSGWFVLFLVLIAVSCYFDALFASNGLPIPVKLREMFFVINMTGVASIIYFVVRYFQSQKQKILEALTLEQAKSEKLLLNILPGAIADRLKTSDDIIADGHEQVTILFADLVDFTKISAEMSPSNLVHLLNQVFSRFDALAEKYQLEKIKTIGDAYMVVGGLPNRRDDHAVAVANFALDMREALSEVTALTHQPLQMRIGINTGAVVAGVIGNSKFTYDIWGDAVNMASRMERNADAQTIQVSESSFALLKPYFLFTEPRTLEIKGKGATQAYVLLSKR